jgi:epoxide hydrolase-like predicted phosphatase
MIKAVVFDAGGVLHTHQVEAYVRNYFGITAEAVAGPWQRLAALLSDGEIDEAEFWARLKRELHLHKAKPPGSLLVKALKATYRPNEVMMAYAQELKRQGLKVAVLSNTNPVHAAYLREQRAYAGFDAVMLSHEMGVRKPAAEAFRRAAVTLGVAPDEAVLVDDSPENVAAAQAVGMHGVVFRDVAEAREAIEGLRGSAQ